MQRRRTAVPVIVLTGYLMIVLDISIVGLSLFTVASVAVAAPRSRRG
jgi:hypothetical protein